MRFIVILLNFFGIVGFSLGLLAFGFDIGGSTTVKVTIACVVMPFIASWLERYRLLRAGWSKEQVNKAFQREVARMAEHQARMSEAELKAEAAEYFRRHNRRGT